MLEHTLSEEERSQIVQTIEMFEVITQTQPDDYQSLEILKEGYRKIGRLDESFRVSRRLAEAYYNVGFLSLALPECKVSLLSERTCTGDSGAARAKSNISSRKRARIAGCRCADRIDRDGFSRRGSEWRVVDRNAGHETQPVASIAGTRRRSAGEIFDRATALPGRRDHGCARDG